jgi:asparagine synthetase B (glutamine-hydrolysing)
MAHACCFRVELRAEPSPYPFRGQFLSAAVRTSDAPILVRVSDASGFLIWKSLSNRDNADAVYRALLDAPRLSFDSLAFATEGFACVFFDARRQLLAFGKDRLGLSTLLWARDPLAVASHDLDGEEHPPGLTVVTTADFATFSAAPYQKPALPIATTEVEVMDHITSILVRCVVPGVPVMFSGGVDSTLTAAFLALAGASDVVLLNFCAAEDAPDRPAARASFEELKVAFPQTRFELREWTGDVAAMARKGAEIRALLAPVAATEMNLNIAMTLYCALEKSEVFAAHSGLGADELFCGYMRMRSETTAQSEVTEHMSRLWLRNGGRDDRVCLHLGKQCVCPFLAPEFIEYALALPPSLLVRPELPRGQGEKWILRQIALRHGLRAAANRPKQAMQFGSKVAKANWRVRSEADT